MKVLFVGDVVGSPGRRILRPALRHLRERHQPDLVVVNGENAAGGNGLTRVTAKELFRAGCAVIPTGNHVWPRKEIIPYIESEPRVIRPANYPDPAPGSGVFVGTAADGSSVAVVNVMGRLFMPAVNDPFRAADRVLDSLLKRTPLIVVDFHAEATSEKIAFGWHLDGRVTAVLGTHTHVQTADERVLPGGTAYITDVGMTGPYDSVIGVDKKQVLERFLTQRPVRLNPASEDVRLAGVVVEADPTEGRAVGIERVSVREADLVDSD
jgi:metallophosphoesterase (TIGR00282 family)